MLASIGVMRGSERIDETARKEECGVKKHFVTRGVTIFLNARNPTLSLRAVTFRRFVSFSSASQRSWQWQQEKDRIVLVILHIIIKNLSVCLSVFLGLRWWSYLYKLLIFTTKKKMKKTKNKQKIVMKKVKREPKKVNYYRILLNYNSS